MRYLFRRYLGLALVGLMAALLLPIAIERGGLAPWVAFIGLGAAITAVWLWAHAKN